MSEIHVIESMSDMPVLKTLKQPDSVWRCVETMAQRHWHFKCKYVVMGDTTESFGPEQQPWLTVERFEPLLAADVPILQIFTLCALMERPS